MDEFIQVGRHSLNSVYLVGVKISEAKETFKHIDERVVKIAWEKANPKKAKK